MEQATKRARRLKLRLFSQAPSYSAFTLILLSFSLCCFNIVLLTTVAHAARQNLLEKTLLLTYAPECSPLNNVAERALRKSLALSIEKQTRSNFARINEGAQESPDLPMSTRVVGDYEAYSTKVITLDTVKFTEGADGLFRPIPSSGSTTGTAGVDGPGFGCTVSEESLKRVGVDVLQLVACPLVSAADVKQALAVDPCVASVELDQQMAVDLFGLGEIHNDVESKPQFSGREGQEGLDDRFSVYDADTRISREGSETEGKSQAESSNTVSAAFAENAASDYRRHSHRTKNSPFRAESDESLAVAHQSDEVYNSDSESSRRRSTTGEDEKNMDESSSSGAGVSVAADANPISLPTRGEAAEPAPEASAIPAASGKAPQKEDFHRHFDPPASIGEFSLLRALIPFSQREEGDPLWATLTDVLPQIFSSVSQKSAPPHKTVHLAQTAMSAKADEAAKQEAQKAVRAPKSTAVGVPTAENVASTATEQQRPPSRHVPLQPGRSDDVDVSYWRRKSGFHTRAYELASCEKNRVIAVIDTGIAYTHPALAANVWVNEGEIPDNGVDDDGNGYVDDVHGYNFRDGTGDPMDDHGHGTHVAGIIGALEYSSGQGHSYAYKRRRPFSDEFGDEVPQELEEQQHEQEGQEQEDEHRKEQQQQQVHDRHQQPEGEDQQQDQEQSSQQEQEIQRRKRRRHSGPPETEERGWPHRVRTQQGVCGETSIAGLKFMGATGNGATSDAIKALNYAVQMNMTLSCNSWGGPSWSEALVVALEAADESGHLFIAAAGNQGKDTDEIPHYPASYQLPNVVSVAATTSEDELAPFSNRGKKTVDVAAPGVKIRSTFPPDSFKELSGTSMATPVVAGLAAMLMSLPYDSTKQIKDAIIKGVDKIPAVAGLVKSGGRINAAKSVAWLANELDLDTDMVFQRDPRDFALPPFYALLDDALQHMAIDDGMQSGGEQFSNEGGALSAKEARAGETEERGKREAVYEGQKGQQDESGEQSSEKGEKNWKKIGTGSAKRFRRQIKDSEQAEDATEGAESENQY